MTIFPRPRRFLEKPMRDFRRKIALLLVGLFELVFVVPALAGFGPGGKLQAPQNRKSRHNEQ